MKSLYLILATTAVVVTSKPQQSIPNDIIWYPVDDDNGLFISIFGEKRKTAERGRWRSNRQTRASGMEPFWSFDPTDNRDASFFNDINQRRVFTTRPFRQQINGQRETFLGRQTQNQNNFQEIFNEVFDYNKRPPVSEFPGSRPETTSPWDSQSFPENQNGNAVNNNQWGNGNRRPGVGNQRPGIGNQRPGIGNQNQWGNGNQRPGSGNQNQWGNGNQRPTMGNQNQWGNENQRPNTGNTGNQRPINNEWTTTTGQRPGGFNQGTSSRPVDSEWITPDGNTNRPNRRPSTSRRPTTSTRPTSQSDKLVFPGETTRETTTSSNLGPTERPTLSPCERLCPVTPEFNPVCGSDSMTYSNAGRLKCAQMCGKNVNLSHYGNCGRTPFSTPLVSNNKKRRRGLKQL